jgi:6-phosphofructokinase 1
MVNGLGLIIRTDNANPTYTTGFIASLIEEEGGGLFDVGQAILGHLQQGGNPTPFDRIQATRLAASCIDWLIEAAGQHTTAAAFIGMQGGEVHFNQLEDLPHMLDETSKRPLEQWWMDLRPIARVMAQHDAASQGESSA